MNTPTPRFELAPGYAISPVIKGAWQLSQGHDRTAASATEAAVDDIVVSVEAGLTTLDFGDIYRGVEEIVGAAITRLRERHGAKARDMIQLHTKYVPDLDILATHSPKNVRSIVDRSRQRLGVEQLDLVQFHWWDYAVSGAVDALGYLRDLQREGAIRLLGVTNFDGPHMRAFAGAGLTPATIQLQYSVLDRRPETSGMIDLCKTHGIKLLCYGTVAGGFLTEKYLGAPEPMEPLPNRSLTKYKLIIDDFGGWERFQVLLRALKAIAEKYGTSVANVASAYVLGKPQVAAVIVGSHDRRHLESNLHIPDIILDADDIRAIHTVSDDALGPGGDVYQLERESPRHSGIMQKGNNAPTIVPPNAEKPLS